MDHSTHDSKHDNVAGQSKSAIQTSFVESSIRVGEARRKGKKEKKLEHLKKEIEMVSPSCSVPII